MFLFSLSPQEPIIRTPITISFVFIPLLVKLRYYVFFSSKIQYYKNSELSSISWVFLEYFLRPISCSNVVKHSMHFRVKLTHIWVKLETCHSWWEKLKTNQDCLFYFIAITAKFKFVFYIEPCLIFQKLSISQSFVNAYKLLCCIYIILFFHFDMKSIVID